MAEMKIAKRLADLPPEKRAQLFAQLKKRKEAEGGGAEFASKAETADLYTRTREDYSYLLSFAQQRLWFLHQYEPESPEYNIPQAYLIEGDLDPEALTRAIQGVVARHETLRTTFVDHEGEPYQRIAPEMKLPVPYDDFTAPDAEGEGKASDEAAWRRAMDLAGSDAKKPFDLAEGPLIRARLSKVAADRWLLYLNVHHIAYDGWSGGVLTRELAALYRDAVEGTDEHGAALPDLGIGYVDFALWQREWLSGETLEKQLAFWKKQLTGTPHLDLPTDFPRPPTRTFNGDALPLPLSAEAARGLRELASKESASLFMVLSAAFKALLHHYTAQDDLALGTLIANRRRSAVEPLIGFFANTLVFRTDLSGDPDFRELIRRERDAALDAYAHQDLPFEKLVDELQPPRDLARTPFFQVMLILLNAPGGALQLPGATLAPVPIDSRTSKMEMTLYMTDRSGQAQKGEAAAGEADLDGFLEYNSDLFAKDTIRRFLAHLATLIEAFVADPSLRLSQAPLLTAEEVKLLREGVNDTAVPVPEVTLPELLARTAAERPEETAVIFEGTPLSYGELMSRARRLARHLTEMGVGPEVLVGIAMERGLDVVVALLAVMEAGGAYVPLDPAYPEGRLAQMMEDSGLAGPGGVLLTQEKLLGELPKTQGRVVAVDRDAEAIAARDDAPLPRRHPNHGEHGPDNLAYVLYTSGSTGRPKGVAIPQRALVNFLRSMAKTPGLTAEDTLLAVTTLSFDIAGLELYLPLLAGGRLLLASRDEAGAGERLVKMLQAGGLSEEGSKLPDVTAMQATPATWRLLIGAGWEGKAGLKVLCGGEALPRDLANELVDKVGADGEVWNVYGPTEATIWSTLERIEKGEGTVPIGRPLDNTHVHVLNRYGRLTPLGVPGELLIGGMGLARCYRGRPDLTADRFVPNPLASSNEPGSRLYRTGDLARRLPDGRLECLGRLDHQVKVRGFRIELGDIEAALLEHPAVAQAVVLAREDSPGAKRLVGYLVPVKKEKAPEAAVPDIGALKDFLKERLPEYMVPALFVDLEEFPLTPNGKVDRRSLPAPDVSKAAAEYVAPRNSKEETMADIWAEVLKLERVGVNDNFFDLGGDSLLVIRAVTKAGKAGIQVTTKQLFQNPTVAELVAAAGTVTIIAEQGPVTGELPYTPAQLHFMELDHPNPAFHSLGALLQVREGRLSVPALARAMERIMEQHDTLRLRMLPAEKQGGRPKLWIDPPRTAEQKAAPIEKQEGGPALLRLDLSRIPEEQQNQHIGGLLQRIVTSFDLEKGPLFKGVVLEVEAGEPKVFFLTGHFYPADVGSWQPMLDDLDTAYGALVDGKPIELQPKTTSAVDWAKRLAERARPGGMPEEERVYWLEQAPVNPARFETDFEEGKNAWVTARTVPVELDEEATEILLSHAPRAFGVQIDGILVTSIVSAFVPWTGRRSLPILLLCHGREALFDDMDVTRTAGWFNTIYPANIELGREEPLDVVARRVNRQLRDVPHGGLGYGLLRYLSDDPEIAGHLRAAPEPQVFFNYFGSDNSKELTRLQKLQSFGGYPLDHDSARLCPITLGGYVIDDKLLLKWEYSTNLHRRESVEALAERSKEVLDWFVAEYRRRHSR